ncbi:MAG: transposase [Terriglobales bacterium]
MRRRKNCSKVEELVSYRTFPKLEMVCDCAVHLILCAYAAIGPALDLNTFRRLLFGTLRRASVQILLADAGYDSESNHRFARDGCHVRSVIPPLLGRPTDKLPSTPHRRLMRLYRDYRYGQRSQSETVISMIKRNLGAFVAARSDRARSVEVMLKVLTHNIMLIAFWLWWVFYRAVPDPFVRKLQDE